MFEVIKPGDNIPPGVRGHKYYIGICGNCHTMYGKTSWHMHNTKWLYCPFCNHSSLNYYGPDEKNWNTLQKMRREYLENLNRPMSRDDYYLSRMLLGMLNEIDDSELKNAILSWVDSFDKRSKELKNVEYQRFVKLKNGVKETMDNDKVKKYWMIHNPSNTKHPAVQHTNSINANLEAKRLAEENPGQVFMVLGVENAWLVDKPQAVSMQVEGVMPGNCTIEEPGISSDDC